MSLRQKFEGVGCKRFGDNEQTETNAQDKSKGKKPAAASATDRDETAALEATIAGLKKQIANQALEIAELRQRSAGQTMDKLRAMSDNKNSGQRQQKPPSSKGGRPPLPLSEDERQERRRKQFSDANQKRRKPKP